MERETTDVLISGGGLAGLITAAAFGHAGHSVIVLDPSTPTLNPKAASADHRSTAFLQPAKHLLSEIGLWDVLLPFAVPLDVLRIVDTVGDPPQVRGERAFRSEEMGDQPFGWNFLNWLTRRELLAYLSQQSGVELRYGTGFRSMLTRTTGAIVTQSDGHQIAAKLVIGADGRESPVREAVGIRASVTRYGQKALAFTATHLKPHQNISTEIYHRGGPFTMVPLADIDGKPSSAIVWMNEGRRAVELANMGETEFNAEMMRRSAGLFGPIALASPRALWQIITLRASGLVSERTALIAEAAHVLPPIGAQGLNTSLNDVTALLSAAKAHPENIGGPEMLAIYAKSRETDIARRARAIDLFNRVTRSGDVGLQALRFAGLKTMHDLPNLRKKIMQAGMGPGQ